MERGNGTNLAIGAFITLLAQTATYVMNTPARTLAKTLCILLPALAAVGALSAAPTIAYPQPQPSAREQYILELVNAARANPAAEGQMLATISDAEILRYYNYYHVSTNTLAGDFTTYAAKPPLAFNAALMASSHVQAAYQAGAGVQTHDSADGTTFDKRITAAGYKWSSIGENVYAYAEDPYFGHVGLNTDWGVPSLDHRANIMNTDARIPTYREVGIACVDSSIKDFGPVVITQDFGAPADTSVAYVTGVIYQDSNGNGVYDEGEGLGGVTVTPDAGNNYAVTTASGGFIIPLPTSGAGTLTVTATGGGLGAARTKSVAYTAGANVKLDFTPADAGTELPFVTLSVSTKDISPSTLPGKITLSRGGDASQPLQVSLAYTGTATNGVDCNALPSAVTIPAGQTSVSLDVQATGANRDAMVKLKVHLAGDSGYQLDNVNVKALKARIRIWPKS